jgi:ribosome-associated toxin RatA of RatAB toxin-antitoxin module
MAMVSRLTLRSRGLAGRARVRRGLVALAVVIVSTVAIGAAGSQVAPVSVRQQDGVYRVSASFATTQPVGIARAVLTDYEQIPRFMPDVRSSRILERHDDRTVVEQEAVARVLFFSKRVRLVLEVTEAPASIRFRDRSGESFARYEGVWTLSEENGHALVAYELVAQPAFEVPDFILSRLLKRDADRMLDRLRAEIAARGAGVARSGR